jgi:hypothetical protein
LPWQQIPRWQGRPPPEKASIALPGNRAILTADIAMPVPGANGDGEVDGTVGSIMLAGATLNMCHEIVLRDTRADRG